jgi:hypothetical protein
MRFGGVRVGAAVILVVATLTLSAGGASAAPSKPTILLSPGTGPPGSTFNVHGSNFHPGETVYIYLAHVVIESVTADQRGAFDTELMARSRPGPEAVLALSTLDGRFAKARFFVRSTSFAGAA